MSEGLGFVVESPSCAMDRADGLGIVLQRLGMRTVRPH